MPGRQKPRNLDLIPSSKRCCKCGETKPHSDFHLWNKSSDGLQPRCKLCRTNIEGSQSYIEYLSVQKLGKKRCQQCKAVKPLREFHRQALTKIGYRSTCKDCREPERKAQYAAETDVDKSKRQSYYLANRDARIAQAVAYHKSRPEVPAAATRTFRAKKRQVPIIPFTHAQLSAKLDYWGNRCWLCHAPAEAVDHVKPFEHGGPHALCNLRPVCTRCNSKKGTRWPYSTVLAFFAA